MDDESDDNVGDKLDCLWFVLTESIDDNEFDEWYFPLFLLLLILIFDNDDESDDEHVEFVRLIRFSCLITVVVDDEDFDCCFCFCWVLAVVDCLFPT